MLPQITLDDMFKCCTKLQKLDELNQIIITSKIDILYERQMLDDELKKTGNREGEEHKKLA